MSAIPAIGVKARVLSPFYYHSLAVPSGTASLPNFLTDRSMSFAISAALGALTASPALPRKDYAGHMRGLPLLASVLETQEPNLLPPLCKRLNLDGEGGLQKSVQDATATGNLKTYFFIQEIAAGVAYTGAVFGTDPFELAASAEGRRVSRLVVRTGRHLAGMVLLEPADVARVRLNAHTAITFGMDLPAEGPEFGVDVYALHDMQLTRPLELARAAEIVGRWRSFGDAHN
jgi:hypothetical protein